MLGYKPIYRLNTHYVNGEKIASTLYLSLESAQEVRSSIPSEWKPIISKGYRSYRYVKQPKRMDYHPLELQVFNNRPYKVTILENRQVIWVGVFERFEDARDFYNQEKTKGREVHFSVGTVIYIKRY